MATIDHDGGDVAGASRPKKKLKSIPCPAPDYPGDHYLDHDQIVEEEEEEEEEKEEEEDEEEDECDGYLEGPSRRAATLAKLKFYQPLAEKALTYYNSKECTNLLLKEVLVADEEYVPETLVFMNFVARSEDDSKLFYFFAQLRNGPYPKCRDVNEKRRPVQVSDFHVKELCSLETHDSDYLHTFASRCWRSKIVYPQGYGKYWKMRIS